MSFLGKSLSDDQPAGHVRAAVSHLITPVHRRRSAQAQFENQHAG